MKTTFTKQFMRDNCGCYAKENKLESCSFMYISGDIDLIDIINSEIPLKDKFWFVINKCATIEERKNIAIETAQCVLPIYEKKYPADNRARKAIEAARKYINNEITLKELIEARYTADAAYTAAAYAYAATYDVTAAYAVAAAYAAYAVAATYDAAYLKQLLYILKSKIPKLETI